MSLHVGGKSCLDLNVTRGGELLADVYGWGGWLGAVQLPGAVVLG